MEGRGGGEGGSIKREYTEGEYRGRERERESDRERGRGREREREGGGDGRGGEREKEEDYKKYNVQHIYLNINSQRPNQALSLQVNTKEVLTVCSPLFYQN